MKKRSGVTNSSILAVSALIAFAFLTTLTTPAAAQRASKIVAVDDSDRITLPHTTHPLARPGLDLGQVEPGLRMDRMLLILGPADDVQPQLRAFVDSLHDKKSANYHKWLTPEQFGERFGPSQQDLAQIAGWLQQKGFDSIKPARGRTVIEFSGSAQVVQQAFGTQMHYYQKGSEKHLANSSNISIPRAMSGIVRGVTLDNFSFSKPTFAAASPATRDAEGKFVRSIPQASAGNGSNFLAPGDFAKIYNINPLFKNNVTGTGSTIAVVARSNIVMSDVETFRQAFNLPPNDPEIVLNGEDPGQVLGGDFIEASLDAEWTGAVAPGAKVKFVVSGSNATIDGTFLSMIYIIDNNIGDIMSASFTLCEPELGPANAFFSALYQQAAAQGISVFVGSGDSGAADCEFNGFNGGPATTGLAVNGLSSTPFNTSVGGTQFNEGANAATFWGTNGPGFTSALGYIPETTWNESCDPSVSNTFCAQFDLFLFAATGGGVSTVYPKPSWQSLSIAGMPNDNQRDVPDISLAAASHDGYLFCAALFSPCTLVNNGLASVGIIAGTSASVQAFAGIMALVDQQNGGRQGLANYVLYKLAAKENFAGCNSSNRTDPTLPTPPGCIFNDTTTGNNGVAGNDTLSGPVPPGDVDGQVGYNALGGYDSATGLGSVDATNLVNAWGSVTFRGSATSLSTSETTVVKHGQNIPFNVKVSSVSGLGTPSGAFVLIARNAPTTFNNTVVGGGILADGVFNGPMNSLPGGEYQVVAHYGGDGIFGGSESGVVPVHVSAEGSTVALSGTDQNGNPFSAPGSITLGFGLNQPILVTVNTASQNGIPSGTVTLSDGVTKLAQLPLNNNGQATFINCDPFSAVFCLSKGIHNLTVTYSGDSSSTAATSPVLAVNIVKGAPVFGLFSGCCPANQTTEIEADFSTGSALLATPPTGIVTFSATPSGSNTPINLGFPANLSQEGLVLFRWFELPPGTYTFNASYSGDDNYLATSSSGAPVQVSQAVTGTVATQTVMTTTTNPVVEGQPVTFQVTVSPTGSTGTPTGNVVILAGATFLNATGNLVNGTATLTGPMPNASLAVQAIYSGDATFSPSASTPLELATQKLNATLTLSANATSVQAGAQVTFLATIGANAGSPSPQGVVTFFDSLDGAEPQQLGVPQLLLPNFSLSSTIAALAQVLPAGTHTITAVYSGDTNYNAIAESASPSVAVVVNAAPPALFSFATPAGGNSATVKRGSSANFEVFLDSNGFIGNVKVNCTGAPKGMSCAARPGKVGLTTDVTSVPLVVSVTPGEGSAIQFECSAGRFLAAGMSDCNASAAKKRNTFTLTVTGTDGAAVSSIPLTLTVKP